MRSGYDNDIVYGNGGQDWLDGQEQNDTLYGGDDIDTLYGAQGDDKLYGQNGLDFLYGEQGRDDLRGGNDGDRMYGGEGNDTLFGQSGNDILRGRDDNDFLIGGTGNDTMTGGAGNDVFIYNSGGYGTDTIQDFGDGVDRIRLDKKAFTALGSQIGTGFSNANEFAVVSQDSLVASSNALIVFSRGTGNLFYNQNGSSSGFGTGGHFVTLTNIDTLTAGDFIIRA